MRRVHDGDTVVLDDGTRVRLLGINTPEVDSAISSAEAGGSAATAWLKARIEAGKVLIETDAELKDHYGRTLGHLFAEDGEHLNLTLVRKGLASASIFPPNLKYADILSAAQAQAAEQKLGIWGDPAYAPRAIVDLPRLHLRGWQRWQGRPTALDFSGGYVHLVFTDEVQVRIPKENLSLFPSLSAYVGKSLEVRGWVSRRKDRYSILVRHPSALTSAE